MAFENNELSMNRKVISKRVYASAVKLSSVLGGIHKNIKNTGYFSWMIFQTIE